MTKDILGLSADKKLCLEEYGECRFLPIPHIPTFSVEGKDRVPTNR